MLVAAFAPFEIAIAVSSFGTLLYYVVTNLSALRLKKEQRMFPRLLAVAGLFGCIALAFSLAPLEVGIGLAILLVGLAFRWARLTLVKQRQMK
jgi:basic amino acid/polyamine antiporter, APA family